MVKIIIVKNSVPKTVKNRIKTIEQDTIKLQKTDFNLKLEIYSSSIFSFEKSTSIPPIIISTPNKFGNKSISAVWKKPFAQEPKNPEL